MLYISMPRMNKSRSHRYRYWCMTHLTHPVRTPMFPWIDSLRGCQFLFHRSLKCLNTAMFISHNIYFPLKLYPPHALTNALPTSRNKDIRWDITRQSGRSCCPDCFHCRRPPHTAAYRWVGYAFYWKCYYNL